MHACALLEDLDPHFHNVLPNKQMSPITYVLKSQQWQEIKKHQICINFILFFWVWCFTYKTCFQTSVSCNWKSTCEGNSSSLEPSAVFLSSVAMGGMCMCVQRERGSDSWQTGLSVCVCVCVTESSLLIGCSVCMFWVESLIHGCGGHLVWNWRMETKLRFLDEVLAGPDGSLCSSLAAQLLATHKTHMLMHKYMRECIHMHGVSQMWTYGSSHAYIFPRGLFHTSWSTTLL